MAETTKISWAHATWNPFWGCRKVSPGCKHCYAEAWAKRGGDDFAVVRKSKTNFDAPLRWQNNASVAPGSRIFTCSLSDWFIEDADEWRDRLWSIVKATPYTYLILTKRPENIADRLPKDWGDGYPNVWLGVSAENQEYADQRIPMLLNVPAAIHFVSAEPLLGTINLEKIKYADSDERHPDYWRESALKPHCFSFDDLTDFAALDWVIVGGESGAGFREMKMEWLESIVKQCRAANVPVFVKQDSAYKNETRGRIPDSFWAQEFPRAMEKNLPSDKRA